MTDLTDPIYNDDRVGAFTFEIDGHLIEVCYDLQAHWTMAHFEFSGPVSETGYKSHFEPYGYPPHAPLPTWDEWIEMATEYAIHLYDNEGRQYLNRHNVGVQTSLL